MSSKFKTPKRLEKKAKPPEESTLQAFKTKQTLGRPKGFQSSRPQRHVDLTKTTKGNKLALLRHLNESCPGLLVWAKSWKFSHPLPQPEGSKASPCALDWGQSWKFINLQPSTEGKPWSDLGFDTNNNMTSNGILFLWERIGKALDSKDLKQDLPASEWEKSWIFLQRRKESREGTTNGPKSDLNSNPFYNLWDSRHQENPEWHESWKSTKPLKEGEARTDLILLVSNEEDKKNEQLELPWNTSWMYFKKQLHIKSKTAFNMSVWGESWMVSKTIAEQDKTSITSQAVFDMKINAWNKNLRISQCREGDVRPSEWDKSWVTIKNRSEYREETNKVEHPEETMEEPKKMDAPMSNPPMEREHVKFYVLASPKNQKHHEMLNASCQNNKDTLVSNWKESWKMLKRQRREERALRNQRRPPPQLDAASETSQTEWANSWKFTNFTLNQDTSLWQQGWSTSTQPRPNRHVRENEMLNEYVPHNGPTGVHGWGESWRSTRRQHRMENQGVGASQPVSRQAYPISVADWEQSWESPTNQRHHDRPSMTDWNDSWRFCAFHCDNLVVRKHTWFENSMEIKARKDLHKASYTLNRSFDSQSKEWKDSWRGKKRSDGPGSRVSFLNKEEVLDWDNSWMFASTEFYQRQGDYYLNSFEVGSHTMPNAVQIESKSKWGKSWKIANPQPPKNIASWVDAKPKSFSARDTVLWSRDKHNHYLLGALHKEFGRLNIWNKSWRFMKTESNLDEDEYVTVINITKARKHVYSNIDKLNPQVKRWSDACKIVKTQPRPKHNIMSKSGKKKDEDGEEMFAEWMESWKFSNDLKIHEFAKISVSRSDWENSWKFLLEPYVPVNGPKTSKGR